MNAPSHLFYASLTCAVATLSAGLLVGAATVAQAGVNVWTRHDDGTPSAISAIAIDVTTTPATLYAATDVTIRKSTDAGRTWRAVNEGPPGLSIVSALITDPTTPDTLYAGMQTCAGPDCESNVFRSTDGAVSWSMVDNTGLPRAPIGFVVAALAVDPTAPKTLYAGINGAGVFKRVDGADSWTPLGNFVDHSIDALALDPMTPSTLFAASSRCTIGCFVALYESTDAGSTWGPLPANRLPGPLVALVVDPSAPNTLFAATNSCSIISGCGDYLYESTDGGNTWRPMTRAGLPELAGPASFSLAIEATTPSTVYAGTNSGVFSIRLEEAKIVGSGTPESCTDAALDEALAGGGFVRFDCGGPATIDISAGTGTKTIAADTTIDGGGSITISGGNTTRVFSVNSGVEFVADNLTIADGSSDRGGGIYNDGGIVSVINSLLVNNRVMSSDDACAGAGIYNNGGSVTIADTTFSENRATCSHLAYGRGGGIFNNGTLTATRSTFAGNHAFDYGGAISNTGTLSVANSTFAGNEGGYGGAIHSVGSLTIINSTIVANHELCRSLLGCGPGPTGGGIDVDGFTSLANTILAGNSASGASGGYPGNCAGSITEEHHNLDDGTSCGFSADHSSWSNAEPGLDPAGLQDHGGRTQTVALCIGGGFPAGCGDAASPAIAAGDWATCSTAPVGLLDQRGFLRMNGGCSIGAYEPDAVSPKLCVGDCDGNGRTDINELILGVNMALGVQPTIGCFAFGLSNGIVDIARLVTAVNNALNGCNS